MPGVSHLDYLRTLAPWIRAARRHLYRLPDAPGLLCYGPGNHGHWALQANTTALSAFAVLAVDPATDPDATGMSRDELLATALGMLRFTLHAHHSGAGTATDGHCWGHSWISALCIERVMHAVEALGPHLTDADRDGVQRLLLSESDWLLDHYELVAGLVENNKPESNMWNGALLHRTALTLPDAARAAEYRERGTAFLLNAVSVPADAQCATRIAGRPLREWHVGANFFDSYACNHHRYLNIGYIVITFSNAAMLHFAFRHRGAAAPDALYHHLQDAWPLVRACTFPDGRLMRIGGDTRVRYCYCQDYAVPTWLLMRDRFGIDCDAFEAGWLQQVQTEMAANGDGSFLGARLRTMADVSPLYYTRLEGDRAVALSMGAYWRRRHDAFAATPAGTEAPAPALRQWQDAYHGACLVRGDRRAASWVWRAAEPPQGLCLAPDASDMAEWRGNLAGRIAGNGLVNTVEVETHTQHGFDGGFASCGRFRTRADMHFAEGEVAQDLARTCVAFAALPDGCTVVGIQRASTMARAFLREVKGMLLQIPNDLFNGGARRYHGAAGVMDIAGCAGVRETLAFRNWLNVDDRLGVVAVYGGDRILLHRPGKRQIGIRSGIWNSLVTHGAGEAALYADEICLGACEYDALRSYDAGCVLFDIAFALQPDTTHADTARWQRQIGAVDAEIARASADVRGAAVTGADGQVYLVVANFADTPGTARVRTPATASAVFLDNGRNAPARAGWVELELPPCSCRVCRLG